MVRWSALAVFLIVTAAVASVGAALATEFAERYVKPDSQVLQQKVAWLRSQEKTDSYTQNHHHGPFFPGAETALFDLKTVVHSQRLKYAAQRRNKSAVFAALNID